MVNKYSQAIKMLRAKHDDTQKTCAELIGKSIPTYRSKEDGKVSFTIDEVMVLLEHWDEPINKLQTIL